MEPMHKQKHESAQLDLNIIHNKEYKKASNPL
jgi:hypothetical protein